VCPRPAAGVALHALARDVGPLHLRPGRDLVDLVEKHDAVLLDIQERLRLDLFVMIRRAASSSESAFNRILDFQLARAALAAAQILETCPGSVASDPPCGGAKISICAETAASSIRFLVVEFAFAQFLTKLLPRRPIPASSASPPGTAAVPRAAAAGHRARDPPRIRARSRMTRIAARGILDRRLGQVADDGIDVAADIADFGDLVASTLMKAVASLPGRPSDLGLANAGGSIIRMFLGVIS